MAKEDVKELNKVLKSFILFVAFCIPYLVMALPIFFAITEGGLWWLYLLPVSFVLGALTMNSLKIATETLKEK